MTTRNTTAMPETITPSWDRARDLLAKVRQSLRDWIALGDEIAALQAQFSAQGSGGGNYSRTWSASGLSSGKGCQNAKSPMFSNSSASGLSSEKGWKAEVEKQLGISFQTAYRLMEKARYLRHIKALAEGQAVTWTDSDGETKTLTPDETRKLLAIAALERIVDGEIAASRAWAGIVGEGDRQANSLDGHRGDPNYGSLILRAAPTLKNAFAHWGSIKLGQEDREKVMDLFGNAVAHMPPELKHVTIQAIREWPQHDKTALLKALK